MADDTRKPSPPESESQYETRPIEEPHYIAPEEPRQKRKKPMHAYPKTQAGKMWDAFYNPEDPVNTIPGGQINSAGGRPPEVTWRDAFKFGAFKPDGLMKVHQQPCSRDAFLVGIGAGGAVGGTSFILTGVRKLARSANYAVGAFCVGSIGMYTWCERRRKEEQRGIAMALQGMKILNEKKRREEAEARAKQVAEEEVKLQEKLKNQRWYKFW